MRYHWKNRISPAFDFVHLLFIADVENGMVTTKHCQHFHSKLPFSKAAERLPSDLSEAITNACGAVESVSAKIFKKYNMRIIPVVAIHDAENAGPLADVLLEGGLPCAEITFRTDAAANAITRIIRKKEMLVGAGTVLKIEQAQQAIDCGSYRPAESALTIFSTIWKTRKCRPAGAAGWSNRTSLPVEISLNSSY